MSKQLYRPFSNGTQFQDWNYANCERCVKSDAATKDGQSKCEIFNALWNTYLGSGDISEDIAKRMGYLEEDGEETGRYCWPCNEVEWTPEWQAAYKAKHPELFEVK